MPLSALTQSLQFHSSPEQFISSRLSQLSISDPSKLPPISSDSTSNKNEVIKASILNRNVHIISSYEQCRFVLDSSASSGHNAASNRDGKDVGIGGSMFQAMPAYRELMAAFFPSPNLLLMDGEEHQTRKEKWIDQLRNIPEELPEVCGDVIQDWINQILSDDKIGVGKTNKQSSKASKSQTGDKVIDIYDSLKTLSWELLFSTFLPPSPSPDLFTLTWTTSTKSPKYINLKSTVIPLQEKLLRGQFSLFPVSVRTPLWSSSRRKGVLAKEKLQVLLKKHFSEIQTYNERNRNDADGNREAYPALLREQAVKDVDDLVNHVLLSTSSLANKALSSLLLSCVMNFFLYRPDSSNETEAVRVDQGQRDQIKGSTLAQLLHSIPSGSKERQQMIQSIILETERLSPPVVGVLRRAMGDVDICPASPHHRQEQDIDNNNSGHHVPKGHETWLYFPSASRDKSIFGDDAELFRWDRFMGHDPNNDQDDDNQQTSFAFGAGPKTCLGRDIVRQMIALVIDALIDADVEMDIYENNGPEPGVRAMLGWECAGSVEVFARDLKQLPCQRPRKPVLVTIKKFQ